MSIAAMLEVQARFNKTLTMHHKHSAEAMQAVVDGPARAAKVLRDQIAVFDAVAKSLTLFPPPPLVLKDREIQRLKRELAAKDGTITALRRQVSRQERLLTALAHVSDWER